MNNWILWAATSLIIIEAIWWLTPKKWWDIHNQKDALEGKVFLTLITLLCNGAYTLINALFRSTEDLFYDAITDIHSLTIPEYIIPIFYIIGSAGLFVLFFYLNTLRFKQKRKR